MKKIIKKQRKCFYANGKRWHSFEHDARKEGEICSCGEMIVKNGIVNKLIK